MAFMDAIRRMGANRAETKAKFKQMQEDDRLQTMLAERKKSANERELEKIIENKRQEGI